MVLSVIGTRGIFVVEVNSKSRVALVKSSWLQFNQACCLELVLEVAVLYCVVVIILIDRLVSDLVWYWCEGGLVIAKW